MLWSSVNCYWCDLHCCGWSSRCIHNSSSIAAEFRQPSDHLFPSGEGCRLPYILIMYSLIVYLAIYLFIYLFIFLLFLLLFVGGILVLIQFLVIAGAFASF